MTIDIKDKQGFLRISVPIQSGAKGVFSLMKEDYIELPFSSETVIPFKMGDYADLAELDYEGLGGKIAKIYEIVDLPTPTYNNTTGAYDYQLRLDAYYWKWKHKIFKYTPENAGQEASWSLAAALDVHLNVVLRNLKALGYTHRGSEFTYSIDSSVENKAVSITYDNINILDALFTLASENYYNCDCWITDNVIHFGRNEFGDAVKIERGVEAEKVDKAQSKGTYATRIYAFGGTRNIPTNYRPTEEQTVVNGVVQKRLMLPKDTPYIDAYEGMTTEEAIEDVIVFDDVFPRMEGVMSSVTAVDRDIVTDGEVTGTFKAYQYKDTNLFFNEDYVIEGQELEIIFQSGKLNGMKFGVKFNPNKESPAEQLWEIIANEDYGRLLPDDIIRPENGDKYVLSGFNIQLISDTYIPQAEQELKERAQKYADMAKKDDGTYPVTLFSDFVYSDLLRNNYEFGQKINLIDDAYFPNGRESRVLGWEISLDIPWDSPKYTIGESMPYSRIGNIEDKIDALTFKGQQYVGGGGSSVYVIRTNDSTAPSDSNVFSALRSLATLHRKDKTDENPFLQKFLGGIEIGKFVAGLLGSGGAVTIDEEGNSHAEFDYLTIRKVALFIELVIQEAKHVGGMLVVSHAGMKVSKVEETDSAYRCYFERTDGDRTINNQFTVGSQARRQTFNLTGTSYYWRLVTAVGDDWVDLSKTDCDTGSTIPQEGDEIVGLGHRTDKTRQSAIIISAYGTDAPSIKYYQGIDSYSLVDKEMKADYYDPTTGRFKSVTYGDMYVGSRDKASDFFDYKEDGLDISAKVKVQLGSKGVGNFSDLPDELQKAIQIGGENLLRNTGFTGDYVPREVSSSLSLNGETEMYSNRLEHWEGNATVQEDSESISGYSAVLGNLSQKANLIQGEKYMVSFKAKGTSVSVSLNGEGVTFQLTNEYKVYSYQFTGANYSTFNIQGSATVCMIKLERGTIATDWCPSRLDKYALADEFKKYWYLMDALEGSTGIYGGLVLTSMIELGKWTNSAMEKVNAGISGIYNDGSDVAFWAGGSFGQAIKTVQKISQGEVPTEDDWNDLAKFVATHGGDVFLRGYIYALGGIFRGKVTTSFDGNRIEIDPTTNSLKMFDANGNICLQMMFQEGVGGINNSSVALIEYDNTGNILFSTTIAGRAIFMNDNTTKESVTFSPTMVRVSQGENRTTITKDMIEVRKGDSYSELTSEGFGSSESTSKGKTEELLLYRDDSGFNHYAIFERGIYVGSKIK